MYKIVFAYELPDDQKSRCEYAYAVIDCTEQQIDDLNTLIHNGPYRYCAKVVSLKSIFDVSADLYIIWDRDSQCWKVGKSYDDLDVFPLKDYNDQSVEDETFEDDDPLIGKGQWRCYRFSRDDNRKHLQYTYFDTDKIWWNQQRQITFIIECLTDITDTTIKVVNDIIKDNIEDFNNAGQFGDRKVIVDVCFKVDEQYNIVDVEDQVF